MQQGSIEGGWFFALAANAPFQKLNDTLVAVGGATTAIIDDNYAMGPPSVIFLANEQLKTNLAIIGLELQPAKSCCYIDAAHRDLEWHRLWGDRRGCSMMVQRWSWSVSNHFMECRCAICR